MRGDCYNALLGRDTASNVTFQAEFFPGGDFEYRYEDRTLRYRVIVPYDWDDDGIHNERDGNPTAYDGDFFGVANALPSNANTSAYYWLDLSVTGRAGVAEIRITCDGVSNLGDHLIIARTNDVCHVPLLIGASYSVESDLPFECVAASDSRVDVQTIQSSDKYRLRVEFPLAFGFSGQGATGLQTISTAPVAVSAELVSVTGGCCSCSVESSGFSWSCVGGCPSDKPTFPLHVVTNKVRHISVWIAAEGDGSNAVRAEEEIFAMLPTINDVFSQIGMSFVIDSVNVLCNNKALMPYYYENSTNGVPEVERENLTFNELVAAVNASDIKCIFVKSFAEKDKKDTLAATLQGAGIILTSKASVLTLAHELGHELGRPDIYDFKGGVDVLGEVFWYNHAPDDWSNGCATGGSGYYRRGVMCHEIILRALMYGYSDEASSKGRDMTLGDVYGVYILQDNQCTKGKVNIGFLPIMNGGQ